MRSVPPARRIQSPQHPLLKAVRRMGRTGELLSDGMVLLETVRLAEDALRSGATISKVLVPPQPAPRVRDLLKRMPVGTEVCEVATEVFEDLPSVQTSQGILALAVAPQWQEKDLFAPGPALVLVLAGLQDPGNVGTILRSAEAFSATGVLLTRGTASPYNAKVVRATAGSLFRIPLLHGLTAEETAVLLRRHRVPLFAGTAKGGRSAGKVDWRGPAALAIGSEGAGLTEELAASATPVTIPISPAVESLNAATAAAVLLYEIARQRKNSGK